MSVLLISTYEMGRQPFGLASPAAFLEEAGFDVACLDLSVQRLDRDAVERAALVAFYLPMHTAARIALDVLDKVVVWNPDAHVCLYGLYALASAKVMQQRGACTILGGEFEEGLVRLAQRICPPVQTSPDQTLEYQPETNIEGERQVEPEISLKRQQFRTPSRNNLPALAEYAHLTTANGARRTVGYTETTRGCKHMCRHCPVVPIYGGQFRVIQPKVVLADIEQQVVAGAEHITFGDPDFLNGPKHAAKIVTTLHKRYPHLTYDVTVKVEHLLAYPALLSTLRETGCVFVTSAIESVDNRVLEILDKGHTRDDFFEVVRLFREAGLALQPTFVAFTPWTTLDSYADLLSTLIELNMINNVPSIQLAIRLLIPAGSCLLEVPEVNRLIGEFEPRSLGYPWRHSDSRVDELQREIQTTIEPATACTDRLEIFAQICELLGPRLEQPAPLPPVTTIRPRATIPYLSEPWYC
ncbi:MAG TPA: CUAEP/CCAEP-tail radical SAM protein [Acidobacteriota bacterium]|nr:CUAEP/CCAEP-tail radical SAM protein [Acidobacteriota bacterium]